MTTVAERRLLSSVSQERYLQEIKEKLTKVSDLVQSRSDMEDLLTYFHGPTFWENVAGDDFDVRANHAKTYGIVSKEGEEVVHGENYTNQTKHWIAAANETPQFSLGMPAGLAVEGFSDFEAAGSATVCAEFTNEGYGKQGFFLVSTGKGEWYAPW